MRIFLLILLLPLLAQAEVYKWRDAQGRIHYSDRPVEGAQRLDLTRRPPNEFEGQRPSAAPSGRRAAPRDAAQSDVAPYARVAITRPAADETFRNTTNTIPVQLALEPGLRPGHRVQFLLDGAAFGQPVATPSAQLTGVERGSHSLAAVVLDGQGQTLARSATVSFHYHKPSVAGEDRDGADNQAPNPLPGAPAPGGGAPRPPAPMGGRSPLQ
ncbi:DUF4124 domain-containing protein [Alkalilimnicola sp. S0819]|uniref:DUF4124 domain-containing protein n=1 Tax=Alkalilimnicola sp. S0819 TaxID=2613922 RepID=UPI001869AF15|nr:DUF4124 domain-containing protein [Alkalilimnicola sp. S0819]